MALRSDDWDEDEHGVLSERERKVEFFYEIIDMASNMLNLLYYLLP